MSDLAAGRLRYVGIAPRHMASRTNRQGNAEGSLRRRGPGPCSVGRHGRLRYYKDLNPVMAHNFGHAIREVLEVV